VRPGNEAITVFGKSGSESPNIDKKRLRMR
jgi:hypothetical protein